VDGQLFGRRATHVHFGFIGSGRRRAAEHSGGNRQHAKQFHVHVESQSPRGCHVPMYQIECRAANRSLAALGGTVRPGGSMELSGAVHWTTMNALKRPEA